MLPHIKKGTEPDGGVSGLCLSDPNEQNNSDARQDWANRKVREPYITDNPFRLVGAGAGITQQQLRRKSEAISRSATVGLKTATPLETEFGSEDIEDLVASVRSLATASSRRTVYRIMWPLSDHAIPHILSCQTPSVSTLTPEEVTQLNFLSTWYGFLRDKSPLGVAETLNNWIDLYNDSIMDDRLKTLIMEDDNLNQDDAYERLIEAQEQVARHLLRRTASVAAQEWEAGNTTNAIGIVEALLNSALDETMQEEALDQVIEIGQGLAKRVEQLTSDLPPYTRGASTDPPREVVQLERLSSVLTNRHPMAGGWDDIVQGWYLVFGWKMRKAALELNMQDDDEGAIAIVKEALSIVRDADLKERLLEDRTSLEKVLADKERNKPYAEIEPISDAPGLSTINGIGTMLYGSAPFPSDHRLRYSILYFVLFYIPLFPLERYVVEPTGRNQWKFFGKTKWTQSMKVHLAVTCTLILVGIVAMMRSPGSSSASSNSYGTSTLSAPTTIPATGGSTSDSGSPAAVEPAKTSPSVTASNGTPSGKIEDNGVALREQHRQHLEEQLKVWKEAIESARKDIASDDRSLDEERTALESLKARIDGMKPDTQVQQEVDDYNALVQSYEAQRRDFNAHVERHNSKLEVSHEAVRRHNEIVDELNKDR